MMNRRALVLENDEPLQGLISAVLTRQGIRPAMTHSAGNALEELGRNGAFDLIVLDLGAPGSGGRDVFHHLRESRPDSLKSLVVMTSGPDGELIRNDGNDAAFRILRKPFELHDLEEAVKACLARELVGGIPVQCMSCEREEAFAAPSDAVAREMARKQGWHVVTFVRYEPVAERKNEVFITFCPGCAKPAAH